MWQGFKTIKITKKKGWGGTTSLSFFTTNQFSWRKIKEAFNKYCYSSVLQHEVLQQRHLIAAAIRKRAYAVSVGINSKPSLVQVWYNKQIKPAAQAIQNNK